MQNWRFKTFAMNSTVALKLLSGTWPELGMHWDNYIKETYNDGKEERSDYIDVCEINQFVFDKLNKKDFNNFDEFFSRVETILIECDEFTENLIVVGLLEGLQNQCGDDFDYHTGFDQWLKPKTKKAWDEIIHFWESDETKKAWEEMQNKKKGY